MRTRRLARLAGVALVAALAAGLAGCTGHGARPAAASQDAGLTTKGPFAAVSGRFGQQPTLSFPAGATPSDKLQRKILSLGHGPKLAIGDLVVADYLGQVWGGPVFQNSYRDGQAVPLQFGVRKLLPGIDSGLLGVPVGSRVELTVPPKDAYGSVGDPTTGVKPDQTLVYVLDLAQRYNGKSGADPTGTPASSPAELPKVGGKLSVAPLITFPTRLRLPAKRVTLVVARGHGAPLKQGTAIVQYYGVNGRNQFVGSTWLNGTPTAVPVGAADSSTGGMFDDLVGVPVGSRVLVVVPAPPGPKQLSDTAVAAVDVLAQLTTAAQMAR